MYKSLKTILKAEINEESWDSLRGVRLCALFLKPVFGRIAAPAILQPWNNKSMRVFRVWNSSVNLIVISILSEKYCGCGKKWRWRIANEVFPLGEENIVLLFAFNFSFCNLYSQPVFEVGVFEDHLVLDLQDLSHSGFGRSLIHGVGDADVGIGKSHGVEVNALVIGFSAGFLSGH